jgi:hypothetical protein
MAEQKHGPLRSVSIRVLEGGFIGSCSYDPVPQDGDKKDQCCTSPWIPDKEYSLPDEAAATSFVTRALKGEEPYKPRGRSDDEKWENAGKDAKSHRAAKQT